MSGDLRPRLCVLEKSERGYGFHLHGAKSKPGQFIRHVEPDSPAAAAGLLPGDQLLSVNGRSVERQRHQQVVSAIRAVTGKLELIVIDPLTAELLKTTREECVTGGVPVPSSAGSEREDEVENGTFRDSSPVPETDELSPDRLNVDGKAAQKEKPEVSVSLSAPAAEPPKSKTTDEDTGFSLNLSLQQVRERAHLKRCNRRAPPMDWSKRNELFSNF